jgi:hypothetical protein
MPEKATTPETNKTPEQITQEIIEMIGTLDVSRDKALINKLIDKISEKRITESISKISDENQMKSIYDKAAIKNAEVWKSPIPKNYFITAGVLAFITFCIILGTYICKVKKDFNLMQIVNYSLYFVWAMGPPSFFFYEYMWKFPYKSDANQLADLKYTHELASKIWAALLVVFGILLYSMYGVR